MMRQRRLQAEVVLDALRQAEGRVVSRRDLTDALYPPGIDRPASAHVMCDMLVVKLRQSGHRIYCDRGRGYGLGDPPPLPVVSTSRRRLPGQQAAVLSLLAERRGQVVPRTDLIAVLYPAGADAPASAASIPDRVVSRLRSLGAPIERVGHGGYRLPETW